MTMIRCCSALLAGCAGGAVAADFINPVMRRPMLRKVGPVAAVLFLFASISLAQTSRSEVSASFTGNFSKESDGNSIAQTASNSGGFLASYRFSFGSFSAVELNYGYTRNDQNYNFGIPIISSSTIQTDVHEATAAYVLTPRGSGRLKPFVLGGGGALIFNPINNCNSSFLGAETQARGAILYGAGVDYKLFGGVGLRLQYRGLFYKAPDFNVPGFSTGTWEHMAEPAAGLLFRF
jgi:outer membrane immunogenic protein